MNVLSYCAKCDKVVSIEKGTGSLKEAQAAHARSHRSKRDRSG